MVSHGHEGIFYGLFCIIAGILILVKGPSVVQWDIDCRRRAKQPKWTIAYTEFWGTPRIAIGGGFAIVLGVLLIVAEVTGVDISFDGNRRHLLQGQGLKQPHPTTEEPK